MKEETIFDNKSDKELNYYIGQNAKENWDIIDKSNQNDIWFHLSKFPSSHVILSIPKKVKLKDISKFTLIHCANKCKQYSKLKNSNQKIKVIYTEIKNIKKGKEIGSVFTKKEKYITI